MMNPASSKDELAHAIDNPGQWFQGTLGQAVLHAERNFVAKVLPDLFGYHILQVGAPAEAQFLDSSRINHKVITDYRRDAPAPGIHMICDQHALPVGSDSVDVMVLPHVLEFDTHPHQVLREMERVLIGEGHVVIIGFNPWSLWGLWRLFNAWRDRFPWNGKYIRMTRLRDWLALLDFEIIRIEYFYYRPPLENPAISKKLGFMEQLGRFCWRYLGGIYLLVAKKRVIPMTPVKMQWQMRRHMLTPGVAEPSA
jgi:SAM-dependent methyltransferase